MAGSLAIRITLARTNHRGKMERVTVICRGYYSGNK